MPPCIFLDKMPSPLIGILPFFQDVKTAMVGSILKSNHRFFLILKMNKMLLALKVLTAGWWLQASYLMGEQC